MKEKIVIWGTGVKGEQAYKKLEESRFFEVTAFGDNNSEVLGSRKYGKKILGISEIQKIENLKAIVIASSCVKEIREQLESVTSVPIYDYIDELICVRVCVRIAIDISGFCNAKCKWCVTGRKNRKSGINVNNYMKYEDFVKLYFHLYDAGIIEKSTEIMLYSWGEPLLNRDYIPIVEFLAEQNQCFSVSTNASQVQLTQKKDTYKNCCSFIFSMPGFSQSSYDRIHGFLFERIKKNIRELNENIRENGFSGDGSISFHVYRFNHDEIDSAKNFSDQLKLRFDPYYPYFNGNSMTEAYLEKRMDESLLKEAGEELDLSHVKGILAQRPEDYRCCLENIISIDWKGNLVLCCAADENLSDYEWESIYQIKSVEEMRHKREEMLHCNSCKKCRSLGIDYWMQYNPSWEMGDEAENR